jgi:hypothetical protein
MKASSGRSLGSLTMSVDRSGSGSLKGITPSRTVAMLGRLSGDTIVAMMLPPKAGRIWRRVLG